MAFLRKLKHPVYKLDAMPESSQDYFYFENDFSGKQMIAYTGTIIRRPGTQSGGIMYHYCLFYGFIGNIPYVLHNDKYGVECISLVDYMENWRQYDIVDTNPNNDSKEDILNRAKEKSKKMFHLKLNNCEHFVYYAAYGIANSTQAQVTGIAQDLLLWAMSIPVIYSNDQQLINRYAKFKRTIGKPYVFKRNTNDINSNVNRLSTNGG